MNSVFLLGELGTRYGAEFSFDINTAHEAIEALIANLPEFSKDLRQGSYHIVVGKSLEQGVELDIAGVAGFKVGGNNVYIVPEVEGAKRGGLQKLIFGIALVGLSAVTGGAAGALMGSQLWGGATVGSVAGSIGTSMVLTGIASLLSPETDGSEDSQSFTMAGPQASTREGGIVPIIYGEVYTAPVMISGGVSIITTDADERVTQNTTSSESVFEDPTS